MCNQKNYYYFCTTKKQNNKNIKKEMKDNTKRHLLLLLLSGMVCTGKATDIINEDFSTFGSINYTTTTHNGWTLDNCYPRYRYPDYGVELKYISGDKIHASAESPAFATLPENRSAILTFYHAQGANNAPKTFTITLNHQGTIRDAESTEMATDNTITVTTISKTEYSNKTCYIYGASTESTLTFKSADNTDNFAIIDDVVVTAVDLASLSESTENTIDAAKTADVTLIRTLKGGIWNTLCLPFDVDKTTLALALGDNQDIQLRTFSSYEDGVIRFTSTNSVSAGTPFLIKVNSDVPNPTFKIVNVVTTPAQTIKHGAVSMVGVYSPTELPENGVFLSTDGMLKRPTSNSNTLAGLRAYFTLPASLQQNARIFIDNSTSGIAETEGTTVGSDDWHSLDGRRLSGRPTTKGLYICNGKKMILK